MRLLSVTVRNYRIHREQEITFDPKRTLIGGPNEAGKSTLVEAIHRALFLKAKGNTEYHRAMESLGGGQPEVELSFELGGERYTVRKRFGINGTTNLLSSRRSALSGDEAEQKLADLLSVEPTAGRAALTQWAHLWVWQGKACEDPSTHATTVRADLIQRLQALGAAAVLQSERDTRIAAETATKHSEIFTSQGKPKAGSELDAATRAETLARTRRETAAARVASLESAAAELERARAEIPRIEDTAKALEQEEASIGERRTRLAELQRHHLEESHRAQNAAERHETLTAANARIAKLQAAMQKGEASLAPLQKELAALTESASTALREAGEAQRKYDAAADGSREGRLRREFARIWLRRLVLTKERHQLESRQAKLAELRKELTAFEENRGKLPQITQAAVRKLQKAEMDLERARHAVTSVATGIELLECEQPAQLGGEAFRAGERLVISEETELTMGGVLRLRIFPGGGTTLAQARKELSELECTLQDGLAAYVIDSVASAAELLAQREQLGIQIEVLHNQIEELNPGELQHQLGGVLEELAGVEGTSQRLQAQPAETRAPEDEASARAGEREAELAVEKLEAFENAMKAARDSATTASERAAGLLVDGQTAFDRQNQALEEQRAEARVLIQTHGMEEPRHDAILLAEQELKLARNRVDAVSASIEQLQPKLLEADANRVKRSLEQIRERKAALGRALAAAEATLRSDGLEDPQATLAASELQLRAASARLQLAQRHASAIALLHKCFQEEQQALSEQFTRPLANKISAYLQCVFGPGTTVSLDLTDTGFSGLTIGRRDALERFAFETLSGGTQEQVAAAVRLAMAEVLAANYDRSLPIVFDDAFVYSDPDRVQRLQRMLDHAAESGLQVIVLTCSPNDYAALGAHQVMLRSQTNVQRPVAPSEAGAVDIPPTEAEQLRFLDVLGEAGNTTLRDTLGLDGLVIQGAN